MQIKIFFGKPSVRATKTEIKLVERFRDEILLSLSAVPDIAIGFDVEQAKESVEKILTYLNPPKKEAAAAPAKPAA